MKTGTLNIKRHSCSVALGLLVAGASRAQTLVTTAKADNNIIYPGAVIAFNATDALISFNYTQAKELTARPGTGVVFSMQANAKPTDGIGPVFSSGDFSPDATVKGAIGYRWGNEPYQEYAKVDGLTRDLQQCHARFSAAMDSLITAGIGTVTPLQAAVIRQKIRNAVTLDKLLFDKMIDDAASDPIIKSDSTLHAKVIGLKAKADVAFFQPFLLCDDSINQERRTRSAAANEPKNARHRFLVYADGSLRALAFKRSRPTDTTNFSKSFYEQEYQGGEGRVGFNWAAGGRLLFGLSVGYGKAENLATLAKTEYTIRTNQANQSQQLVSERKVTAYAGEFRTFERTSINLDLCWFAWQSDSAIIAIDPYLRHYISSDKEVMPSHTDIGLSLNFFRARTGAFCGGLYVESSDVSNAIPRAIADRNNDTNALNDLNPFYQRLTVGLTLKLSLASMGALGRP